MSECAFGPDKEIPPPPPGPPPSGGGDCHRTSKVGKKNLKCSCTTCTLRFQNFSPVSAPACCRQVRTRTGRPPCLQTKSIILPHPRILTQRFSWRTHESWSRPRDVIANAEQLPGRKNPRFIVTNISSKNGDEKSLYEGMYCARGDMENRIKEQQLYLFADRTCTWGMSSNQLRLWFSTIAYIFFVHLRKTIQKVSGDETRSMPSTIRLRMLKISAAVKISARRVWISLPESFPWWDIWIRTAQAI